MEENDSTAGLNDHGSDSGGSRQESDTEKRVKSTVCEHSCLCCDVGSPVVCHKKYYYYVIDILLYYITNVDTSQKARCTGGGQGGTKKGWQI